ncbi:MAG: Rv2993c-like domain-containing protein [Actinomycetes bacterium]
MRIVSYDAGEGPRAGVLADDGIAPAGCSLRELLADPAAAPTNGMRLGRDDVRLLPPVPDPQKIICVGLNYRDHA